MTKHTIINLAAIACATLAFTVSAQEESGGWRFELSPYAWFQGIDGTIDTPTGSVDFEKDFHDLKDSVDLAGSFLSTARYDRWVILGQLDLAHLNTDNDEDGPNHAKVEVGQLFGLLAGGYTVDISDSATLDIMAGVRYAEIDNTLTFKNTGMKMKQNAYSTDGVVVLRGRVPITERFVFSPMVSVGAGDADLVYDVMPELQFLLNDMWDLRVGYRHLHYDMGNVEIDFSGLVAGVGVRF